jgi:hypothetical protein
MISVDSAKDKLNEELLGIMHMQVLNYFGFAYN